MPQQKSTTTLAALESSLTEALRRLIEKDEDKHPFVIVETIPRSKTSCFVQFAGSKTTPLVYDCPPLGVFNYRCLLDEAVRHGVAGLNTQGVVALDAELQITESEDRPRGGIRDFLRSLLPA